MDGLIPVALLLIAFLAIVFVLTRYRAARARGDFGASDVVDDDDFVIAADAWGEANAQIILGSLHSAGIEAVSKSAHVFPRYASFGWGRYRVYVRARDLREARRVLGYPPLEHLEA